MKWNLVTRNLCDLLDHTKNPRHITRKDYQSLKESVKKFGLSEKIVINKDNMIIGGHQRKRVLEDLGITETDCWVPDRQLTHQEACELCVRFNKNAGEWDWDILANYYEPDDLCEWGFSESELEGHSKEDKDKKQKKPSLKFGFDTAKDMLAFIHELTEYDPSKMEDIRCMATANNGKITITGLDDQEQEYTHHHKTKESYAAVA